MVQLRYATADEFAQVADLDGASFGFVYSEQDVDDARLDVDLNRMLVALDSGRIVGASCEVPFELTLPGGRCDAVGLTWVSVEITHRRQGILRAMAEQQARTCAAPAMILTASQGALYGRYGFGVATRRRSIEVHRHEAHLAAPTREHGVRRIGTAEAREVLPALHERWRRGHAGGLDRDERRWQLELLDRDYQRGGRSALFHLVHDDGYVSYRIDGSWDGGHANQACWLVDYAICSPAAHTGIWQVLLGLDLVSRVMSDRVPLDDPVPLLLTDPRAVRTTLVDDALWLRPVHVPALLSARTYGADLDIVLGVVDPLLGDGAYRLRGDAAGATCARTDDPPQVTLGVAELGSLLLGGTRVAPLALAGRVRGEPEVLRTLDRAFLGDREPHLATYF